MSGNSLFSVCKSVFNGINSSVFFFDTQNEYYCAGEVALPLRWCGPETLRCTDTTIETKEVGSGTTVVIYTVLIYIYVPTWCYDFNF